MEGGRRGEAGQMAREVTSLLIRKGKQGSSDVAPPP